MNNRFSASVELRKGRNVVELEDRFTHIKGFELLRFEEPKEIFLEGQEEEKGIVILEGRCDVRVDSEQFKGLGGRSSVFSGLPSAVYAPMGASVAVRGENALVAVCRAACNEASVAKAVYPDDIKQMDVGRDNWRRDVRLIIGPDSPSVNLLVGETVNPAGNWSGVPPARHENHNPPEESLHEEMYYFKTDKPQGWGIERIYSPERGIDEILYIGDNTVAFMPWGYHEVAAAPGYTLYYLFFLAGRGSQLIQYEDPEHNWIKEA